MPKKILIPIIIVAVLITVATVLFVYKNQKGHPVQLDDLKVVTSSQLNTGFEDALPDCESNPNPDFAHEITDFSKVMSLTPPVTVQGDDLKTHGYIHLDFNKTEKVPAYAPVDARAYQGAFYDVAGSGPLYTFFFEVSCEVRFMFDHISEPIESLKKEMPAKPADSSQGINFEPVTFKAGDLIGYVGNTEGSKNWDLGVYNSEESNPYRDKKYEHSDSFRYLNAVCPYEYFSEKIKAKYKKLFTDSYGNPYKSDTNLCTNL